MDMMKYYKTLQNDSIFRTEFMYPHGQDKRTYYLNKIIKNILFDDSKYSEYVSAEFRCEIPNVKYNFSVTVPRKYTNSEILWEAVYHTVEKALVWYDLSDIENFDIKIDDGGFFSKCTYYDLVLWGINRSSVFGSKVNYSTEKKDRILQYGKEKFEREQKEWEDKYKPKPKETEHKIGVFSRFINKFKLV